MNVRHSTVSGAEIFIHHFDQEKYTQQNIDQNKHIEEQGGTDYDDDDDDDVVSSSSEEYEE